MTTPSKVHTTGVEAGTAKQPKEGVEAGTVKQPKEEEAEAVTAETTQGDEKS